MIHLIDLIHISMYGLPRSCKSPLIAIGLKQFGEHWSEQGQQGERLCAAVNATEELLDRLTISCVRADGRGSAFGVVSLRGLPPPTT